jgi:hypothetical protein
MERDGRKDSYISDALLLSSLSTALFVIIPACSHYNLKVEYLNEQVQDYYDDDDDAPLFSSTALS